MKTNPEYKAIYGCLKINNRHFYVCEGIPGKAYGPWCIVENNGDGKGVVAVIREGIEGTRNHAIKLMEKIVPKMIHKATGQPS